VDSSGVLAKLSKATISFAMSVRQHQWRTEGRDLVGSNTPKPEITKALQNRAKLNPIVKTVKYC